jgi:hypothetical protein
MVHEYCLDPKFILHSSRILLHCQPARGAVLRTQGVLAGEIFSAQKKLMEYLAQSRPRLTAQGVPAL